MSTVPRFLKLLQLRGSPVRYRRVDSLIVCPCRTPEGFRDPQWHLQQPTPKPPLCNEAGYLPDPARTVDVTVKGFIQPIQSTRATRLNIEILMETWGDIEADDHLAILPYAWNGTTLNFYDWGNSGEDFVEYNGRRFTVINVNLIPDPSDGSPTHHWELGLRLITNAAIAV